TETRLCYDQRIKTVGDSERFGNVEITHFIIQPPQLMLQIGNFHFLQLTMSCCKCQTRRTVLRKLLYRHGKLVFERNNGVVYGLFFVEANLTFDKLNRKFSSS